jgi:hypothetical protein
MMMPIGSIVLVCCVDFFMESCSLSGEQPLG